MEELTLEELKNRDDWKEAVAVIMQDSFTEPYTVEERSYKFSRDNKYFKPTAISNSIFSSCLDGKDDHVRLDWYVLDGTWEIEYCYIIK